MKTLVSLRDQESVLARWRGADAQIWIFDVSLKRMAIRIYRPHEAEVLYIAAVGCRHITGPFSWVGADISIETKLSDENSSACRVFDTRAGFELRCSDAQVARGPATDFEKTFDHKCPVNG
jgi:hypothetical protein